MTEGDHQQQQGLNTDTPRKAEESGDALRSSESSLQATRAMLLHARTQLSQVVAGQTDVIDEVLMAILCQGHVLLEGVPGIAKTLIVKGVGKLLGLSFHRVQATPDLMPADILGTTILVQGSSSFTFHEGAVFTDILLVDEINRMPPRTQAALLECMEERQVTSDGVVRPLPLHFTVFATQNPIDFEGTYPLPEAQLDRFLLKTRVHYPTEVEERQVLELHLNAPSMTGSPLLDAAHVVPLESGVLEAARREVHSIRIEPELLTYILALVRRTREWPTLTLGASPRAALSLMRVAQAVAALEERRYIVPDDIKRVFPPVLRHRIRLKPEAELEGVDTDRVLADILAAVPIPRA